MLPKFSPHPTRGALIPGLVALVAALMLVGHLPGSPLAFLVASRSPAMPFDSAVTFLVCAGLFYLTQRSQARLLRMCFGALLLILGLTYTFVADSALPATVEIAGLHTVGLPASAATTLMPLGTAAAFALWGLITLSFAIYEQYRRRSRTFLLTVASLSTLLGSLGALSLLCTLAQLPLSPAWDWSRFVSRVPPESAALFFILGVRAAVLATRRLPASNAQRSFFTGVFAASSMLLLFIGVNVTLKVALNQNLNARVSIRQAHVSRSQVESMSFLIRKAESGQRGYLLTFNAQYLDAYHQAAEPARALITKALPVGDRWPEVQALRQTVGEKLDELAKTIALEQAGRGEEARALVQSGLGQRLMDRAQLLSDRIGVLLDAEIDRRNAFYWQSATVISRTVFASYGLASALLVCAVLLFRSEIRRRSLVEKQIRANELNLESIVAERTAELQASENRFRALLDQSPLAAHIFAPNGDSRSVNPAFERMFGVRSGELQGYNVLRDTRIGTEAARRLLERAFAGEVTYTPPAQHLAGLPRPASLPSVDPSETPWLEITAYPVKNSAGFITEVVLLCQDVTARETALQSVQQNEAQFRLLANSLPQIIWTGDAQLRPTFCNTRWQEVTGRGVDDESPYDFFALVHPNDREASRAIWTRAFTEGIACQMDYRLFDRSRGEYRWFLASGLPSHDENGRIKQWFCTLTDIHEQKEAEALLESRVAERTAELHGALRERETLFKEVHHRVKNNLQVISSLLRMKAQTLGDAQPAAVMALDESRRRVQSMAFIHESLYSHGNMDRINFAAYTATLVRELIFSYESSDRKVDYRIDADPVFLDVEQAIPCGLILNELVTNALKYAFRDRKEGVVFITLRGMDEGITLEVADNGIGLPDGLNPAKLDSLGLPIVEILTRQIGGRLTIDRGNHDSGTGATFTIRFKNHAAINRAA